MSLHIYNSLTRSKEEFIPLKAPLVNIYTCGVTVYDESHVGHARSLYTFDLIRKYLLFRGFKVIFVRNITDIDDKIINRSNELKIDWKELVDKFIGRYYEDLKALAVEKGDFEPRATENIPEMIKYIEGLISKGYAYAAGGDVYFSVRKFASYGKLSGQGIDQMETGVRVDPSEFKADPLDFALWKSSKKDEPFWESPWGKGRPGWHIECSVMSQKFLKTETLDIHAGGRDLIFPHHENETAQAEALTGKPFAKYWIHHGLLTINGQKMSKSLGNFVTIKDFVLKYRDINFLKIFFLSTHYSHPIDYTDQRIHEAKQALERIIILLDKIGRLSKSGQAPLDTVRFAEIDAIKEKFIAAMDDDFNTPQALACVFELVNAVHKKIDSLEFALYAGNILLELLGALGIYFNIQKNPAGISDEEIKLQIEARNEARSSKDFALADKIRKALEVGGVILEDEKGGTVWRRKI